MKKIVYICDGCKKRIGGTVYQRGGVDGEYCNKCIRPELEAEAACTHEDNISDEVPGRATARLICKDCGYDRVEAVKETV